MGSEGRKVRARPAFLSDFAMPNGPSCAPSPASYLDKVILAAVREFQVEVGKIEAQAVARGCSQLPGLILIVAIRLWETRGHQASEYRLRPL